MDEAHERKQQQQREREWQEEVERREREWKDTQQRKIDAASKLINYIGEKLQEFVGIDFQKKLLGYHSSFDSNSIFRELDQNNKGYLTAEDLQAYLGENEDFAGFNFENLVRYMSSNGGNRVSYIEF